MTPPSRLRSRAGQEAKRLAEDVGLTDNHSAAFRAGFMSAVDWMQSQPSPAATGERDRVAREGEVWAIIRRACRDVAALPGMMTTTELEARIDAYAAQAESAVLATLGRDAPGEPLERRLGRSHA